MTKITDQQDIDGINVLFAEAATESDLDEFSTEEMMLLSLSVTDETNFE